VRASDVARGNTHKVRGFEFENIRSSGKTGNFFYAIEL
jgi:hypothetical protein